jgi:hypothetical protein
MSDRCPECGQGGERRRTRIEEAAAGTVPQTWTALAHEVARLHEGHTCAALALANLILEVGATLSPGQRGG